MRDTLNVKKREELGTRNSNRVRRAGLVPAVLYGHGEATLSLSIPREQVAALVRHSGRLVDLAGDVVETALVRQVQWDAFGIEVLHLDLSRVSAGETVDIVLPIELRGTAIGLKEGGIVEHVRHEVKIRCPVLAIPEKLEININSLHLHQSLFLKDLVLPEGAKLLADEDEVIVHCITPKKDDDEAATATGDAAEPEVIGRKKDEEGDAEAEKE